MGKHHHHTGMNELQGSLLSTKSYLLNPLLFFFEILSKFVRCFEINPSSILCKWTKSEHKNWISEGYSWSTNTCTVAQWDRHSHICFFSRIFSSNICWPWQFILNKLPPPSTLVGHQPRNRSRIGLNHSELHSEPQQKGRPPRRPLDPPLAWWL